MKNENQRGEDEERVNGMEKKKQEVQKKWGTYWKFKTEDNEEEVVAL
jgi:hypothetical protein